MMDQAELKRLQKIEARIREIAEDLGLLTTETTFQVVPAHRIYSRSFRREVGNQGEIWKNHLKQLHPLPGQIREEVDDTRDVPPGSRQTVNQSMLNRIGTGIPHDDRDCACSLLRSACRAYPHGNCPAGSGTNRGPCLNLNACANSHI